MQRTASHEKTDGIATVAQIHHIYLLQKSDSKTDSKADILTSTTLDNYGQRQRLPSATSACTPVLKASKRASKGVRLSSFILT